MVENPPQTSFILKNSLTELDRLRGILEQIKNEWQLTDIYILQLNLVLDELFTNIISHGYEHGSKEQVAVTLKNYGDIIEIIIRDSGKPFDPTAAKKPQTGSSLAETPDGGLGIFLARQYTDSIDYKRAENKNILTLTKKI